MIDSPTASDSSKRHLALLVVGALGVVYGDIGTSPLYALRECFNRASGVAQSFEGVLGVLSLLVWSLILVVSIKYVLYMMSADNRGEGGELALMALAHSGKGHKSGAGLGKAQLITWLGLFGASFLYGDGMITPAISVLSAVEGIQIVAPVLSHYVVPITLIILVALFLAQRHGTRRIGVVFGPVVIIWFITLAVLGLNSIQQFPQVLHALWPSYALNFLLADRMTAIHVLAGVCLAVTGAEALYADMGHFGKFPIRLGWLFLVLPALILNYLGQGALILRDPVVIRNPFYLLAPDWAQMPLVILATLTTVIASQAVITGTFSITRQAVQLGFLPRIKICHTSSTEIGQIYVPLVNFILCISTLWLVITFGSSSALAGAYGIAVSCGMVTATVLMYFVVQNVWGWSWQIAVLVSAIFLAVDLLFLGANLTKILNGGWFSIVGAAAVFTIMTTWRKGREILGARLRTGLLPLECFVREIEADTPLRVPGTAVFLSRNVDGAPPVLLHHVEHTKVLHQTVIFLQVLTPDVPHVPEYDRVRVEGLGRGFFRVVAHYGFMESPSVEEIMSLCRDQGFNFSTDDITFIVGRETVFATKAPGMAIWREHLFSFMSRNAQRPVEFFHIPRDRVIELGMQVEI